MAHRIANNGMRNFTHHQPLSVLQAFAHRRRGATVAAGRSPGRVRRRRWRPARCPAGPLRDSNSACNLLTTKLPN